MTAPTRIAVLVALVAALLALPAATVQDPEPAADVDPFRQEQVWNFALLQYVDVTGTRHEIPAGNIEKIWLLDAGYGRLRMEILFDNRDYSSIELHDFSIIRTAATAAVDIPIVRDRLDGMAFPAFR